MSSLSRNARIAGFLYLGAILLGLVRLIYIPSVLFVTGNAAAAGVLLSQYAGYRREHRVSVSAR